MPYYNVTICRRWTDYAEITVEARDEAHALEVAEATDDGEGPWSSLEGDGIDYEDATETDEPEDDEDDEDQP